MLASVRLAGDPPVRNVPAAVAAAEKAVQLNPTHAYYQIILGYALLESGQPEAAATHFAESRRSRAALPDDAMNLFGLAICAHQAGDAARARAWFALGVSAKDSGRFPTELPARLLDRLYRQAAEALGLPGLAPKE